MLKNECLHFFHNRSIHLFLCLNLVHFLFMFMRKIQLFASILAMVLGFSLHAQTVRIMAITENDTYVYIDDSGNEVFEPSYFDCYDYSPEGVALVARSDGRDYRIINISGEEIETDCSVYPIINDWSYLPYGFSNGMLRVTKKGQRGAINYIGKLTVPHKYEELTEFNSNHAIGSIGKQYFIVSKSGGEIPVNYEKIKDINHYSEGLAPIRIGKYYGYIDTLGQIVVKPNFKSVGFFHGGYAWAKSTDNLVGYINKTGEWVIEPTYFTGKYYDPVSGLARVKGAKGWGYVDMEGNFNNFNIRSSFYSFAEGLAVYRIDDKIGYINHKGEVVIEPVYHVAHAFKNGYARVEFEKKWGIIDKEGNWVIKPIYKKLSDVIIVN